MYVVIAVGFFFKISSDTIWLHAAKIVLAFGAALLWLRSMRLFAKFATLGPKVRDTARARIGGVCR